MTNLDIDDDAFGHWLAGLVGEGCFGIYHSNRHRGYHDWRVMFAITLREDDGDTLREIHRRIPLGRIYRHVPQTQGDAKPTLTWRTDSWDDARALVGVFDRYPLRSKKARDYAIWREAVLSSRRDWSRLARLRDQLSATRSYVAVQLPAQPDPLVLFPEGRP